MDPPQANTSLYQPTSPKGKYEILCQPSEKMTKLRKQSLSVTTRSLAATGAVVFLFRFDREYSIRFQCCGAPTIRKPSFCTHEESLKYSFYSKRDPNILSRSYWDNSVIPDFFLVLDITLNWYVLLRGYERLHLNALNYSWNCLHENSLIKKFK